MLCFCRARWALLRIVDAAHCQIGRQGSGPCPCVYVTVKCFQKCSQVTPLTITSLIRQDGQLPRPRGGSVGFVYVVSDSGAWKAKAPLFRRGTREALSRSGQSLSVSLPTSIYPPRHSFRYSAPSWEFFNSLEYEWSVIRGHRTYRWSIWVCNTFLLAHTRV